MMNRIIRRHWLTGEWEEVMEDRKEEAARINERVLGHAPAKLEQRSSPWSRGEDFISKGMSIAPEQATPERIERENAEAKHHGTGAYYRKDGTCVMPTRGIRAREMKRKNRQDNDGSYGDYCGG